MTGAAAIEASKSATDATKLQEKMDLLKSVQKVVRNELLSERSLDCMLPSEVNESTDACAQGKEYESTSYKTPTNGKKADGSSCPPMPNMANYIKKDQIPCWGCSLDY